MAVGGRQWLCLPQSGLISAINGFENGRRTIRPVIAGKLWLAKACLLAACLMGKPLLDAHAQTTAQAATQASPVTTKARHLHIAFVVKDADYRRQVLALTPLGSTYDQVRRFVVNEWMFQGSKVAARCKTDRAKLRPFEERAGSAHRPPASLSCAWERHHLASFALPGSPSLLLLPSRSAEIFPVRLG